MNGAQPPHLDTGDRPSGPRLKQWICSVVGLLVFCHSAPGQRPWNLSPYRIRIALDVRALPGEAEQIAEELTVGIRRLSVLEFGPLWVVRSDAATPESFDETAFDESRESIESPPGDWIDSDKVLFLRVTRRPSEYRIAARELDLATRRLGAIIRGTTRQRAYLSRAAFETLRTAFAPIARFRVDRDAPDYVLLEPRGAELVQGDDQARLIRPGDVFLPVLRQNDRQGQPRPDGIRPVPWTYLLTEEILDSGPRCSIHSGRLRPLSARRRARVEQYALAIQHRSESTVLQLQSDDDKAEPLSGCGIYLRDQAEQQSQPLGQTDGRGRLVIPPADQPLRMLWIKSGRQVLARVPLVSGYRPVVVVPLPDDESRLRVEGQLIALRERLIDLVARRNILIARAKRRLEDEDFTAAAKLIGELDELPTRSQLSQEIASREALAKSSNPLVQARIDRLFAETRSVLGEFLDPRDITQLQDQLNTLSSESRDSG